jgi:hypothetical protein
MKVNTSMSLLADEWLNQQGYFTIRGGVDEVDLLAIKPDGTGKQRYVGIAIEICRSKNVKKYSLSTM